MPGGTAGDLREAVRHVVRRPSGSLVWIGTLALALGVAAGVFGLVDAVLLRPLPFPHAGRLVRIHTAFPGSGLSDLSLSAGEFADVQERSDGFEAVGGFIPDSYTLTGRGDPARLSGVWATPGFFRTLGVAPALGRTFRPDDRSPGAPRLAVLSARLWRTRFGADPDVVGRTIRLDGVDRTVVGVMPESFDYPAGTQLWTSLRFTDGMLTPGERGDRYLRVVGRLRPGLDAASALTRLDDLVPAFRREHPEYYTDPSFRLTVTSLRRSVLGDVRAPLLALLAGVALVLLVTLGNLANVSLVRAADRGRAMAIRAALGASRGRLVRQVLLENFLLGTAGGLGGIALAWPAVGLLARLAPPDLPRLASVHPDLRVLAFGLGAALLVGLGAGAVPALLGRGSPGGLLRSGGPRAGEGAGGRRARDLLVGGQVALTLLLLIGAGLVVRSLDRLGHVDPGMDPSGTLTARLGLPSSGYPEPSDVTGFYGRLLRDVHSIPGVRSAGATAILPLDEGGWDVSFRVEGRPRAPSAPEPTVQYRPVTPGFFETLGIPLRRGRRLARTDGAGSPLVAIVNEAFARRYLSEGAPGARIRLPLLGLGREEHVRTVVGVVGDVRETLSEDAPPILYVPLAQQPHRTMTVVLRGDGPPGSLAGALRARVAELDPSLPLYDVRPMQQVVDAGMARPRFISLLLGLFSLTGLALACLGIWAVVAYSVARRDREVGIRMALGATPRAVVALVGVRGMMPVVIGVAAGLLAALPATGLVRSLLFGVGSRDPDTLLSAAALILCVGAAAAWLPARRASRVDPMAVLREE